ncbi:MAG: OmpH family outer membrane protein [Hymenobacter sp.]
MYVESAKLLDGYQGMKDARRSFEGKAKGLGAAKRSAGQQLPQRPWRHTRNRPPPSPPSSAPPPSRSSQQQQQQGAVEQQKIQQQAQEAEGKLTQTVLESVNKKVEAYGKARGYKLILIAAPSGRRGLRRKESGRDGGRISVSEQRIP